MSDDRTADKDAIRTMSLRAPAWLWLAYCALVMALAVLAAMGGAMSGFCASCPFAGCEGCAYQPRSGTERGLGAPQSPSGVCADVRDDKRGAERRAEGEA